MVLTSSFLDQLKPALVSQNSSFLLGPTGNGKTNIVGRLVRIYLDAVAIPYAVLSRHMSLLVEIARFAGAGNDRLDGRRNPHSLGGDSPIQAISLLIRTN